MSIPIPIPNDFPPSPTLAASFSSTSSGSPIALCTSTLSVLNSFLSGRAEEEKRFAALQDAAGQNNGVEKRMMSVDEYRLAFGEDWQLSQFWYTTTFAERLARALRSICEKEDNIAFVCCPTGFVALQYYAQQDQDEHQPHEGLYYPNAKLFEVDSRFNVLAPGSYVKYDMNEPEDLAAELKGTMDIVVVDPPYLNETTNIKLKTTIDLLLKPGGKVVVLTSRQVTDILHRLYPGIRETKLEVEHTGLANDFACWGNWEGAEDFGENM